MTTMPHGDGASPGDGVFAGPRPVVVGHRGARRVAPENTPQAFAAAVEQGAAWVELDVRLSADETPVVIHDPETDDGAAVIDLDDAALADRGIPTLADVLAGLPAGCGADVEIKHRVGEAGWDADATVARSTAQVVAAARGTRPLLITSFDDRALVVAAAFAPDVPRGLLSGVLRPVQAGLGAAQRLGCSTLAPHFSSPGLSEEGVAAAHQAGLSVLVWTVNGAWLVRRLHGMGVDAICTDDVEGTVAALRGGRPGRDGSGPA